MRSSLSRTVLPLAALGVALVTACSGQGSQEATRAGAHALGQAVGDVPFMGWSSWSVQSTKRPTYGIAWLNESHIRDASEAMAKKLQSAGYRYINLDSFWSSGYEQHGVPLADPTRFPSGVEGLATYLHDKGQKLGLYGGVGLSNGAYDGNYPIENTACHTQEIIKRPARSVPNGWGAMYEIDWSNPCSQAYYDSIAARFATWGVDLLKIDGTTAENGPDINAWQAAISKAGRPMWLTVSAWPVPLGLATEIRHSGQSVRIDTDVECYCSTVSSWTSSVNQRWNDLPKWLSHLGNGHFPDLDSMPINNDIGVALQDGINDVERQSVMTFWSMASAPLYVGGDIYFMDDAAQAILTNPEVIAIDQAARLPTQVRAGEQPIWSKALADGTQAIAVYNLGGSSADIAVDLASVGVSGDVSLRDLVSRSELGVFRGSWVAESVPSHGSRLIKVTTLPSAGLEGYTFCSTEYGACVVPDGADVAFGAEGHYRYKSGLRGKIGCDVGTFGDPLVGWRKGCYTRPHGGGGPLGFARCAGENGTCEANGVVDVAYGADGRFEIRRGVYGKVACDNATFGDPAVGYPKSCYARPGGGGVAYEAEAGIVIGSAEIAKCSSCSGGKKVGYLGAGGRLSLPHVDVATSGVHSVTIHAASADPRTLRVSVNGRAGVSVVVTSKDWSTPTTVTVGLPMNQGANELVFDDDTAYAPDLDRVVVK